MKPYKNSAGHPPGTGQQIPAKLESMVSAVLKYIETAEREGKQEGSLTNEN
ncbi:MAG: hypothetical protein LBU77_04545 [Clostridiales bacterium]|jgi:hypothetical protein|nr:hypothetical protein [Clostridiales bacterium]